MLGKIHPDNNLFGSYPMNASKQIISFYVKFVLNNEKQCQHEYIGGWKSIIYQKQCDILVSTQVR